MPVSRMSGQRILERVGRNSFFAAVGAAATAVGGLVSSVLLARGLGPSDYGRYSYTLWLVGILALVGNLGLPNTVVRYIAEYHAQDPWRARYLYRGLMKVELAVALLLAAAVSMLGYFQGTQFWLVCCAGLLLVPTAVGRIAGSAASGLQHYEIATRAQLACVPLQLLLFVAVLAADGGVVGVMLIVLFTEGLRLLLLARGVGRIFAPALPGALRPFAREEGRRICRFATAVFALTLLDAIVWQKSEVFFLERFSTLEDVGVYSLCYGLTYMIMQLPVTIGNVLFPVFAEAYGRQSTGVLAKGYCYSTKYLALISIPLGTMAMVLAPQIISLLYGAEYVGATPILRILLLAGTIVTFNRPISTILYSTERQNFVLGAGAVLAAVNLLCDLILIPRYGAVGAGFANGIAQIAGVAIGAFLLLFRMKYPFPGAEIAKITLSAAVAGTGLHLIRDFIPPVLHLLVCLWSFPVVFGVGLKLSHPWNEDDARICETLVGRFSGRFGPGLRWVTHWLGMTGR